MVYKLKLINTLLFLTLLFLLGCSPGNKNNLVEFSGSTMGTTYSIKVIDENLFQSKLKKESLKSTIDSLLSGVNNQMSTWQKDSEITLFNASKNTDWFNVSNDFVYVIEEAQKISEASNGALDITVGQLVNLWGFGPTINDDNIPSDELLKKAKSLCNYKMILFDKEKASIRKELEDVYIDLSSIAKGFGVDKISNYIKGSGYNNFLVEIGGEVRASGKNHLNELWKIGISVPDGSFDIQKIISLDNAAVATSGDYRNYFEKNGIRYSHTIDPRTGRPINHSLASVSVVYDNCTAADGFATAIEVLGPEEGYKLALKEKLPVLLIVKTDKGFIEKMTPEFKKLFKN